MTRRPFTARAARWSATHRRAAIGVWLLFVATAAVLAALVPLNEAGTDDLGQGESHRAARLLDAAGMTDPATEQILLSAPNDASGPLDEDTAHRAAAELTERLEPLEEVVGVGDVVWSSGGDYAVVTVTLEGDRDEAGDRAPAVRAITETVDGRYEQLRFAQTGTGSIANVYDDLVADGMADATTVSVPVTLIIMLVAFGSLVAAAIPVVLALSAVVGSLGLYALASYAVPDAGTVASMVMLIGMAVGVDYSLFFVKRQREERQRGSDGVDAIEIAARTAGHSVMVSGLSVIVAVSALFVVGNVIFSGLAAGAILVVGVAMAGSLTVLPAVVAASGRWIDRPRVPLLWRVQRHVGTWSVSERFTTAVVRRPKQVLVAAGVVVALLAAPAMTMQLQDSTTDQLPEGIDAVETLDRVQAAFPAEGAAMSVVASVPAEESVEAEQALLALRDDAIASGDFAADGAVLESSHDGTTFELELRSVHPLGSGTSRDVLGSMRDELGPTALDDVAGIEWMVGGDEAQSVDFADQQTRALPLVLAFIALFMSMVMALTFRSARVVALTVLLSIASIAASIGMLVAVFQYRWAESLLDHTSNGSVLSWIPLFVIVVLLGLSMDYHVLALSRIREAASGGAAPREAIVAGMRQVSGTIVMAALVMVSVFALFGLSGLPDMKQMGVGLAVGVLIDAVLVRLIALPAVLAAWPSIVEKMAERRGPRAAEAPTAPRHVTATAEPEPAGVG